MSRGFIASLAGIGMTIFSWYGPWELPAWPAFAIIRLVFGKGQSWLELPYNTRAAVLVALIAVNVGVWAGVAWGLMRASVRVSAARRRDA